MGIGNWGVVGREHTPPLGSLLPPALSSPRPVLRLLSPNPQCPTPIPTLECGRIGAVAGRQECCAPGVQDGSRAAGDLPPLERDGQADLAGDPGAPGPRAGRRPRRLVSMGGWALGTGDWRPGPRASVKYSHAACANSGARAMM